MQASGGETPITDRKTAGFLVWVNKDRCPSIGQVAPVGGVGRRTI